MADHIDLLPTASGSYVLVLRCEQRAMLTIGRLGEALILPGWYLYTGSALGPGGLRGRLRHHLRSVVHPHWHIDYLRQVCAVIDVWYTVDARRWEHDWATLLATTLPPAPSAGFGASDCRCAAHGFYRSTAPAFTAFVWDAQWRYPGHPTIERFEIH